MQLKDTAGQEDFAELRVLGYKSADCFILCFSVVDKGTFQNLEKVWLPEVRSKNSKAKILLVGTKADLRRAKGEPSRLSIRSKEVSKASIKRLVEKHHLHGYMETSSKQRPEHIDTVFEKAARLGLGMLDNEDNAISNPNSCFPSCFSKILDCLHL